MANEDYPSIVNEHHIIEKENPCNVNQNMLGLDNEVHIDLPISVNISGEDYRSTVFHDAPSVYYADRSTSIVRPEMIINPDTDIAIDCIKQIALCNGKCPKKVSDGETDDLQCPCSDFIYHGNCNFGLFIEK